MMNIAFLAHDKKKELMVQFCTAYKSVLNKHNLFATATTGRLIADNTGLPLTLLLSHKQGGHQQINARIAYNEIDLVLMFTDPNTTDAWDDSQMVDEIQKCHNESHASKGDYHYLLLLDHAPKILRLTVFLCRLS